MPTNSSARANMALDDDIPGLGHNNPPERSLRERLADDYADMAKAVDDLAVRANAAPKVIADDEQLKVIGDIGAAAARDRKVADGKRSAEKEPFLTAGREVDAFFAPLLERLDKIKRGMEARATVFNNAKIEAERRVRQEAERRQREEADALRRAAEQAAAAGRTEDAIAEITEAVHAEAAAEEAAAAATVSAADLTRSRTDSGTLMTTATTWTHEIVALDQIPLDRLRPYLKRDDIEKAIRQFVRNGNRDLPGVRIFEKNNTVFRS